MWGQFWHDAVRNLGPVYFGLAIVFVVTTIVRKRLEAKGKTRATYVLTDGGLNAARVTLDAQLGEAERRRILSAHGAVLSTYAPAFEQFGIQCPASALTAFKKLSAGRARFDRVWGLLDWSSLPSHGHRKSNY